MPKGRASPGGRVALLGCEISPVIDPPPPAAWIPPGEPEVEQGGEAADPGQGMQCPCLACRQPAGDGPGPPPRLGRVAAGERGLAGEQPDGTEDGGALDAHINLPAGGG